MKNFLVILMVVALSSCGFKPAYRQDSRYYQILNQIEVQPVNSIEGVEFYNHLLHIMPQNQDIEKLYSLKCNIEIKQDFNIIQENADILRQKSTILVHYEVVDIKTGSVILKDKFHQFSSHTTNLLPYNNYELEQNSYRSLALSAAEEVRNRLIHKFSRAI